MSRPKQKSHESWRDASAKRRAKSNGHGSRKWTLTILGGFLICVLVVLIFAFLYRRTNYTHVVAISPGVTKRLALPPIRYAKEDIDRLRESYLKFNKFDVLEANEVSQLDTIDQLGSLKGCDKNDRLIVYISAHGIAVDEKPYLLCRDLTTRLAVSDVLNAIKTINVKTKLVVFDSGHILSDPHIGVLCNDFQLRLSEVVQEIADPTLWVLTSSNIFEIPQVRKDGTGTLFGQAFADALHAEQDDKELDLKELHSIVYRECESFDQHPVLMQGGTGISTTPPSVVLASLPKPKNEPEKESEQEPAPESQPNKESTEPQPVAFLQDDPKTTAEPASTENEKPKSAEPVPSNAPTDGAGSEKSGDKKADESVTNPGATNPGALQDTAPQIPTATGELLSYIFARQRDVLEGGKKNWPHSFQTDDWTPTDFSPQIWRRYVEFLVDLDVRSRSGSAFDTAKLNLDARSFVGDSVKDDEDQISHRIVPDYLTARADFLTFAERRFLPSPRDLGQVGQAVAYLNRTIFYMPYYLRWHYWDTVVNPREASSNRIDAIIDATKELKASLERLATSKKTLPEVRADRSVNAQLGILRRELENLDGMIFRNDLFKKVTPRVRLTPSEWNEVEFLLATPLPDADRRLQLLQLRAKEIERLTPSETYPTSITLSAQRQARITKYSSFLRRYRQLIDADDPDLEEISKKIAQFESDQRFSEIGKAFAEWSAKLKSKLTNEGLADTDAKAGIERILSYQRQLQIVDARDAGLAKKTFPCLPFPPPKRLEIHVSGATGNLLRVTRNAWKDVEITVKSNEDRQSYALRVEFPQTLEVRRPKDERKLVSGSIIEKLPIDEIFPIQIRCANSGRIDAAKFGMDFTAVAGDSTTAESVRVELNEIDVQIGPSHVVDRGIHSLLTLHPFPGRETAFEFTLKNKSTVAKQDVKVELHALPSIPGVPKGLLHSETGLAPNVRDIVSDLLDGRLADTTRIASATVALINGNSSAPCKFDSEEQPKADAEIDEVKTASPENGLAMVITDKESNRQVELIEVEPLHPRKFLDWEVTYNADEGEITAKFNRIDVDKDGDFSDDGPTDESPIGIRWDDGVSDKIADIEYQGITSSDQEGSLYAEIAKNETSAILFRRIELPNDTYTIQQFHVDGYPRAFVFQVGHDEVKELMADNKWAFTRINWIAEMNDFKWLYHTWKIDGKPKLHDDLSKLQQLPYDVIGGKRTASFPSVDFIETEIQVDAPIDQFRVLKIEAQKVDQVMLLLRQRQIVATTRVDGQNRLAMSTSVTDHHVKIPTLGFTGELTIKSILEYTKNGQITEEQDRIDVVLNSRQSRGRIELPTTRPAYREKIRATVKFDPKAVGIRSARIALVSAKDEPVADDEPNLVLGKEGEFVFARTFNAPSKLSKGENEFWVKGVFEDQIGRKGTLAAVPVIIEYNPPRPTTPKASGNQGGNPPAPTIDPAKPILVGNLKVRIKPQNNARVDSLEISTTIRGKEVKRKLGGSRVVTFRNVPQGEYEINVTNGVISGRTATGTKKVVLAKSKDFDEEHELSVQKK